MLLPCRLFPVVRVAGEGNLGIPFSEVLSESMLRPLISLEFRVNSFSTGELRSVMLKLYESTVFSLIKIHQFRRSALN